MPESLPDWTGKIRKAEEFSFVCGGCADIWKGEFVNGGTGYHGALAIKVLKGYRDFNSAAHRRLLREARVWSTLSHRYITPLLGISYDFDRPGMPCLVSPYYRHGDVMAYIKEQENVDRLQIITQVASALSYLHGRSIIHGDIKSSNILIDDEGSAVLTDFGLSRILETSGFTTKTSSGTVRHMAVELYGLNEAGGLVPRVTAGSDIWAFAMTILEIWTESKPFSHIKCDAAVIISVASGGRPVHQDCQQINDELWEVLEHCWVPDVGQRPSMVALHQFLVSQAITPTAQATTLNP